MESVRRDIERLLDQSLEDNLREVAAQMPPEGFGLAPPSLKSAGTFVQQHWSRIRTSVCHLLRAQQLLADDSSQRRLEIALIMFGALAKNFSERLAISISAAIVLEGLHIACRDLKKSEGT